MTDACRRKRRNQVLLGATAFTTIIGWVLDMYSVLTIIWDLKPRMLYTDYEAS